MPLFVTIVLDGVGAGAQPDAEAYGDAGTHTLRHVCETARPRLPHLAALGLGRITALPGVAPVEQPGADFGRMQEISAGKDSTTGHWEMAGLVLDRPFPTYPDGFPPALIEAFVEKTGCGGVLGNRPASGTEILESLGEAHLRTGRPIVYTSADSVFQIAAHKGVVPLDRLYRWCRIARDAVCVGPHAVGRVIARPFVGESPGFRRLSEERKDFALRPLEKPVQQALLEGGIHTVSIGKVADLFGGIGFAEAVKTKSNAEGIQLTLAAVQAAASGAPTFVWINLVDFDQEYGHRNDPIGFAQALEAFDAALPALLERLPRGACLFLTADHGNDPTTPGTDHTREYVPLLAYRPDHPTGRDLGIRATFADHAATVAGFFGVPFPCRGLSIG